MTLITVKDYAKLKGMPQITVYKSIKAYGIEASSFKATGRRVARLYEKETLETTIVKSGTRNTQHYYNINQAMKAVQK